MKCIRCGYEIQQGSSLCPYCGTSQISPENYYQQAPQQNYGYQQQPQQNYGYQQAPQQPQQNYGYQQAPQQPTAPGGGGKKKGVIIAAIICALVLIGGTVTGVILYKKSQDETAATEATTEVATVKPDKTTEATTETPTEATTEATTEEPEPVPYAEEYNVKFYPLGYETSGNAYGKLYYSDQFEETDGGMETAKPLDVDDIVVEECKYKEAVNKVIKTEPDEKGYVKYYVEEYGISDSTVLDSNQTVNWNLIPNYWGLLVYDYYGGYKFRSIKMSNGFSEEKINRFKFDYKGEDIEIAITQLADGYIHYNNSMVTEDTDEGKRYRFHNESRSVYIIECPADYDGLVIGMAVGDVDSERIDKTQVSDDSKEPEDIETVTKRVFDETDLGYTDTPDDFASMRLSEVAVPYSAEAMADFFSNKSYVFDESFYWIGGITDEDETMGGERITDKALIEGEWECRIFFNENSEFGYGEEENYVTINFSGDEATLTEEFLYCLWGKDTNQWEYAGDDEPESFTGGYWSEENELKFDTGENPEDLVLRFYTNGYCQHAVGTWGDGVYVFMFRP